MESEDGGGERGQRNDGIGFACRCARADGSRSLFLTLYRLEDRFGLHQRELPVPQFGGIVFCAVGGERLAPLLGNGRSSLRNRQQSFRERSTFLNQRSVCSHNYHPGTFSTSHLKQAGEPEGHSSPDCFSGC